MVDLHPVLAEMLSTVAPVELSFPDTRSRFPLITITEIDNSVSAAFDGKERMSSHDWQIDFWDDQNTPQRVQELAVRANNLLTAHGMSRYFGQLMRDPSGRQRFCMRVRFLLDEQTNYVYRR